MLIRAWFAGPQERPSTLLIGFDNHRQQEGHDYRLDDYVGEHQGLHDWIDGKVARGNIGEDRGRTAYAITNGQQKDVSGTLQNGKTDHGMNQVAAGDQTVEPAKEKPSGDEIWERVQHVGHLSTPRVFRP